MDELRTEGAVVKLDRRDDHELAFVELVLRHAVLIELEAPTNRDVPAVREDCPGDVQRFAVGGTAVVADVAPLTEDGNSSRLLATYSSASASKTISCT